MHSQVASRCPDDVKRDVGSALVRWIAEVAEDGLLGSPTGFGLCGQCGGRVRLLEVVVMLWSCW